MSLRGEITLVRSLTEHAIWQGDLDVRAAWIDLLLRANNRDNEVSQRGESITLRRGQLAWSIRGLAEKWNVCDEKAAKILAYLRSLGCISIKTTRRKTIITIPNYDLYQTPPLPSSVADSVADAPPDSVTESVTESATASAQKEERGDRKHTPRAGAAPEWAEVEAFAAGAKVNADFALDWFERKVNSLTHGFASLRDWRLDLMNYWRRSGASTGGNSGAAVDRPEHPVARRIRLERRLKALVEEMEGHIINCSAPPYHELEKKDYDRLRAELRQVKEELDAT